ncbi:MAG: PAAR domain-containing protein [Burkholderiaceae bacterium]|nr:PAAR domain-containing protein [Burkholderiaceae bacterium]
MTFAARLGDPSVHGGVIVSGFPTVLIGKKPAARITDMHTCPLVTVLVPHVGGPIIMGSPTVLVGFMPQSRMGDMMICVGPPDAIAMGEPTVLVGMAGMGAMGFGGLMAALMGAVKAALSPSYPRSELQPDGSIVTYYSPNVIVDGTPEQQAELIRQLNAVRAGDGGDAFFKDLGGRSDPVHVKVIGDPAAGRELHPGQQSYQNCAVQSSQQIINQATGNNYNEAQMEGIANGPPPSGYNRNSGTPIGGEETILENGGVPAHMEPGTTANVDQALANNQGVISGHDAGRLWNDPNQSGGHAVHTTGAIQDGNGKTLAYTINDTGTDQPGRVVPADDYANSMDGGPIAVTDNPIR